MKNLQRGFAFAPFLLVIGLLIIGGSFFVYKNKNTESPVVIGTEVQETQKSNNNVQSANNVNKKDEGSFLYPASEGEILSLGQTVTLKWQVQENYVGERYYPNIYLIDKNNQKVSTKSILFWNYAKNGETTSTWKVGYLPDDKSLIASAGTYQLLFEYAWQGRNDDEKVYSFSSPFFQIK